MPETMMPEAKGTSPLRKDLFSFRQKFGSTMSTILLFISAFLAAILLNAFVFQPYEVDGMSMEPTLQNGDRLIVFKLGRTWEKITGGDFVPKRGEIIVFERDSANSKSQLIKRVIGLPGDTVVVSNGQITVINDEFPNGFQPDADFDTDFAQTSGEITVTVAAREVFVVGDNRIPGKSLDSRSSLGNVPVDSIIGTLVLRIFPFSNLDTY